MRLLPPGQGELHEAPPAARAGLALSPVHEEAVLEGAPRAVGMPEVVDRRAAGVDARLERLHDRVAERLELRPLERAHRAQGMNARTPQRLVGVDVAHAGDPLL